MSNAEKYIHFENTKLINTIAKFLCDFAIGKIQGSLPDPPTFHSREAELDWDMYFANSYIAKFKKIEQRVSSITQMINQKIRVVGNLNSNTNYNSYITSRIHEFAREWLVCDIENQKNYTSLDDYDKMCWEHDEEEILNWLQLNHGKI